MKNTLKYSAIVALLSLCSCASSSSSTDQLALNWDYIDYETPNTVAE